MTHRSVNGSGAGYSEFQNYSQAAVYLRALRCAEIGTLFSWSRTFPLTNSDCTTDTSYTPSGKGFFLAMIHPTNRMGQQLMLGPLEIQVMEVLWVAGKCSVRDVVERLGRRLAYTTVMTTLDRLFKKGLLDRQRSERAFLYSTRLSHQDWERQRAGNLVAGLLASSQPSRELLLSSLVEAVGQHDVALLEELEAKIRTKRKELSKKEL
jgi:predicted transcriptional regulator